MKPKEQTRLQVLNSLLAEHMTLDQAATLMGVSPRHTRRILADYRKHGAASLSHGHRGRKPANAIPEATRSRVVHLARTVYKGGVCRGLLLKRPCQPSRSHLVAPRGNFRLPVHKAQKPPKPARRFFTLTRECCLEYRRLCGVGEPGGSEIPWLPGVPPPVRGG